MNAKRPVLQPPANGGSMLDEIASNTTNRPPGRPPFAARRNPDPAPAPAVPQQTEPEHEEREEREEREAPAPARPATGRRPARAARPRRQAPAGIPEPPPGYIGTRKPLQVYVDGADHWNLKYGAMVRGTEMSKVVAALVSAFNADPDAWAALIARAEDERVPLGELLAPYLAQAVDDQQ